MTNSFASMLKMRPAAWELMSEVIRRGGSNHKHGQAGDRLRHDRFVPVTHRPAALVFLWLVLILFSPASRSSGVAAVSWWMNMENGTNGAELTTNILNGATVGGTTVAGTGWSIFPGPTASNMISMKVQVGNEQPLSGPVTINGAPYTDAGSTRSFSSRNDRRSHYVKYTLPARQPRVSMGCYIRLENLTSTWGYYDLIHLDGGGYYVVMALRDAPWDPDHPYDPNNRDDLERRRSIRVHSQAPPYVGRDIPIFANKTYWITMLWDTNPWDADPLANKRGTATLRVYDPQTWLPVGDPSVLELSDHPLTAPLRCEDIRFGRCDDHGGTSPASFHYFDDLLVDETGARWPLLPGEISVTALPDPTVGVPIPARLRVLSVDPEGQPLAVTFYGRATGGSPPPAFTILQTNPGVPSANITTATWAGLFFNTEYEWYVTASDGVDTALSPVWRFRTTNNTPPHVSITVPQDNTFFAVVPADVLIETSAGDDNGAVAKVEFLAGGTLIGEDVTSPFSYFWSTVPEGVHVLTAIAQDEQGARATSAPVTITVGGPPLAPSGLIATAQSASEILLAWTDNSGNETGFEIDQSLDGLNFVLVGTVGPNVTTNLSIGLQPATTYYYVVRAFNGAGPSENSNLAIATTPALSPAPPTISDVADQTINQNTSTGPLPFIIGDVETAVASLTVSGSSSNPTLVPDASFVFGGSGAGRTITITPAAGQFGSSTITITVSDGALSASDTFLLTVNAVNIPPTISDIVDQTINEDGSTGPLAFTIGDVETAAASLIVTGSSSNPTLVPDAGIVFDGSGSDRTVTVAPAAGQSGISTITITVSDGSLTASDTFLLTVNAVNTPPTISDIVNQTINEGGSTGPLAFTIADFETAAASLTVSGSSSNPTLVPDASIVFAGSGSDRTVTVTPAANQFGTAIITVRVSDGFFTVSDTFLLTVNAVNTPPTISDITNWTINEDGSTDPLAFIVGDAQTAAASLTVSGSSSNPTLVPDASIVFGGSGPNRTVTVAPAANQFGAAVITITVSDGSLATSDTFLLTVNAVNDAPTISDIANQTINQNTSTGPLAFTIGDVETAAASLTLSGSSSNPTLVPNASIVFGGSGSSRTITVTPAANRLGTATITVTVSDGSRTASDTFLLTVNAVNTPPTISDIVNQAINEDGSTGPLAFTIGDAQTAAASLTVSGSSSNPTLISNTRIIFGGSGPNRTVTVAPATNQFGTATITITVSDGSLAASDTFLLTVNAVNDAPTISDVANQTINQNTSTGPLAFTIGDVETAAASLTVSSSSSNPTLVPNASIVFGGSGASRTVTVTPAAGQSGSSTITVTVSDGALTISDTFLFTVNPTGSPTYLLAEGFEGAGFENTGWTKSGTPNADYTTTALAGAQSLNCSGAQFIQRSFQYSTGFNLYFRVRWNTWRSYANVIYWDNTSWSTAAVLYADANRFQLIHGGASASGTTTLSANVTYHVWVEWTKGTGANGNMKLFVSTTGAKPAAPEASITTGTGTATERIYIGPTGAGPNVVFDRILVSDVPIFSNP